MNIDIIHANFNYDLNDDDWRAVVNDFTYPPILSSTFSTLNIFPLCMCASECRYSTIEIELLSIVWTVKQFHHMIYERKFILETDHRPLTFFFLSNTKKSTSKLEIEAGKK